MNFDDPDSPYNLSDTHILNPEWVTEGVYRLINNNALMKAGGILKLDDLARIFPDADKYPQDKRMFIIEMMRKFEICVTFPDQPDVLLIPELLSINEPALRWDRKNSLNFEYRYAVLPSGLTPRFIVRMFASVASSTYWRSGVVVSMDDCEALVRGVSATGRVQVSVIGPVARQRQLLAAIRAQFREIHVTLPGFRPREYVPLPDAPDIAVEYEHLLLLEDRGIKQFIPQGVAHTYSVDRLLRGVDETDKGRASIHL